MSPQDNQNVQQNPVCCLLSVAASQISPAGRNIQFENLPI